MTSIPSPDLPAHRARPPRPAARAVAFNRTAVLALLALAMGIAVAAIGPGRLAGGASALFQAYVDAQGKMLRAAGNLTADGRSEFAVLLRNDASADALRTAMAPLEGLAFEREADLPGWVIVTTAAGNRAGLDVLGALPQVRLVVPNRGLWICH
jgi:tetrahydromethanopterin S-methyltransferase subunit E